MNNIKSGQGKITFKDNSWYDGAWHEDTMNGEGVFNWVDGNRYTGMFVKGKITVGVLKTDKDITRKIK